MTLLLNEHEYVLLLSLINNSRLIPQSFCVISKSSFQTIKNFDMYKRSCCTKTIIMHKTLHLTLTIQVKIICNDISNLYVFSVTFKLIFPFSCRDLSNLLFSIQHKHLKCHWWQGRKSALSKHKMIYLK